MFNSNLLREFDDEPFTSDPFRAHREHMRQMMRSFSEPFGGPVMPSITDGRRPSRDLDEQAGSSRVLRGEHRDVARNPFGMFDNVMANVRNRMEDMHRNFESMSTDSNAHSFHSSSVMTYSKVGNEPPKVFQASTSTRCAPGGIKETRRALRDSESGMEKMAIGHHIQDRGHVVEKKVNNKTGERELNQNFQNMDESEAQTFEDEWQQKVSVKPQPFGPGRHLEEPRSRVAPMAAIAGPEQANRNQSKSKAEAKSSMKGSKAARQ
ncbi:myeloid leukemia factor 1 isoform X2 [Nelusetta ayraudi]|uniref:myeloid leukemia factor 1 isoform X2 n=1 Tax=Nelusetta ayraudi TaxID=303726 RepID=UPI003F6F0CFF